ncbi:MAG TPA: hypothetical protein VIG06_28615 [Kofleriaceae bacterium]
MKALGIAAAGLVLVVHAAGARAQAPLFPVEIAAAVAPEGGKGGPVLVGRSGQLYAPGSDRVWRRKNAGGVALDVRAALRSPTRPGEVIAVGDDAPPFRFAAGAWTADVVGNRGAATLSRGGGVPALSVGRHVYTLEKDAWVRRTSAAKVATAVWAASPTSILVATSDGALARWDGKRLAPMKTGLPATDPIVLLVGAQPKQVYGKSKAGRWIRIAGTSTAALVLARELDGFDEHAAGIGSDGALLLAGTAGAAGATKAVLAHAEQNKVVPWQDLPALADGDRVAVVFAAGGEVTVASRSGAVRVRAAAGTWSEGRVAGELPPAPAVRGRRPGPARSR